MTEDAAEFAADAVDDRKIVGDLCVRSCGASPARIARALGAAGGGPVRLERLGPDAAAAGADEEPNGREFTCKPGSAA